jgi:hypothetical integral membrane protein (TIGR02206 family)
MNEFYRWFWAFDFAGEPMPFFQRTHGITVLVLALFTALCVWLGRNGDSARRRQIRHTLGWVLLVNEVLWHVWAWHNHYWSLQTMLPLHMCSVMVWLNAWMLLTDNLSYYPFAYFLGIGGAIQALITPDTGIYDFPHFRYWQTFISHGTLVAVGVYLTWGEGYRPTWRGLRQVLVYTLIYAVPVFFINFLVQGNYLFLRHKPTAPTLIDFLGPWPLYILPLLLVAFVVFGLMYLPWGVAGYFAKRKQS